MRSPQIVIHSYNLLAPSTVSPKVFTFCRSEHLSTNYRLQLITKKLQQSIDKSAIICLQEVPLEWSDTLGSLFTSNNFSWNVSHYSQGKMGVAIAFPHRYFTITGKKTQPLSYTIPFPWKFRVEKLIHQIIHDAKRKPYEPYDLPLINKTWSTAGRRQNKMVVLKLKPNEYPNKEFCVGTYHMPCLFRQPPVMIIHTTLCAKYIQSFAKGLPYILAGDFNFKPKDNAYTLLTQGKLPGAFEKYVETGPIESWSPELREGMGSVYKEYLGKEPMYTNFPGLINFFQETLDYIFFSKKHFQVLNVVKLPHAVSNFERLPHEAEPSDHLLIGATLQMKE